MVNVYVNGFYDLKFSFCRDIWISYFNFYILFIFYWLWVKVYEND